MIVLFADMSECRKLISSVTCPRSHSSKVLEPGFHPGLSDVSPWQEVWFFWKAQSMFLASSSTSVELRRFWGHNHKAVWQGHCSCPRSIVCTHGSNWPLSPCCRVSAQNELGISEWFASQSGHAPSDRLSVEIPLGIPHNIHICNAFPCLRLQGCFVVRT